MHVGEAPPFVEEILAGAQLGDLITHCYHCYSPNGVWNSLVDKELRVRESVWQAGTEVYCSTWDMGDAALASGLPGP